MLIFNGAPDLQGIVVLNPKGGSGKSTLSLNIAGYLACQGARVALIDMDPQGSSSRWLNNRGPDRAPIHGIYINHQKFDADGHLRIDVPESITHAVVDAPARVPADELIDYVCGAHAVLIPVLPSDLDIHAASQLVSNLLLVAQVSRRNGRVGVIANRVKERTIAYQQLMRFLDRLSIKVVGVLRDSQSYTRAASTGLCIHEMPPSSVRKDIEQWRKITGWLHDRLATPLTPRDLLRPEPKGETETRQGQRLPVGLGAAAAVAGLVALTVLFATGLREKPVPGDDVALLDSRPDGVAESMEAGPDSLELVQAGRDGPGMSEPDPTDEFLQSWTLKGVAKDDASHALLLMNRSDSTSHRVVEGSDIEGWTVAAVGLNYAVFRQAGDQVTFRLSGDAETLAHDRAPRRVGKEP